METAVAYYKDGVPYDDKGQVRIFMKGDHSITSIEIG